MFTAGPPVSKLEDEPGEEMGNKMVEDVEVPVYTMADELVNLEAIDCSRQYCNWRGWYVSPRACGMKGTDAPKHS